MTKSRVVHRFAAVAFVAAAAPVSPAAADVPACAAAVAVGGTAPASLDTGVRGHCVACW